MKLPHRRQFLHLAAGAAALPAVSRFANAQTYPSRPVRIIVGAAPSGAPDIIARLIGQWLSERLGQPFIIENRPGAGTNIGTEAVVRAPPDGYTLLLVSTTNAINATLYDRLNFDFLRDIAPVASVMRYPYVMVVNPSVPAKSVPEFTAYAGKTMTGKHAGIAVAALLGALATAAPALAQNEQFIPALVYRTGAYAPTGVPVANGIADYYTLVNERDGGVNGVKIVWEECEFGYATDRGVECYERLKGKGPTGAAYVNPFSTGVTFALTEKAPIDKIPLISMGYGRSESRDGSVFQWNFPLLGAYWTAADIILQHIAKKEGGFDKLKGKKIALVYHDSPYGKEPIALLQKRSQMHGFELMFLPVTHPGVEQKATWLQIRQNRPDYVLLWGWGVMNSTAIKEAVAVGYPREKMYGVWWSGAEPDV